MLTEIKFCKLKGMLNMLSCWVHIVCLFVAVCTADSEYLSKQSGQQKYKFDPLIFSNSTQATRNLYSFLESWYGEKVISGQTTQYYQELVKAVGKAPMIRSFDMQNYSPHNPWFNWKPAEDGTIQAAIDWYNKTNRKGIVSFQWHWFSPMGGVLRTSTFYTNNTDFNLSQAVTENTKEYNETIRDIDAIAVQLQKLQINDIPILWRPLHEAGGGWFWWGSKTSRQTLKLYSILKDRLSRYHQINNLIWIWSTPEPSWYPGNSQIDMLGFDSYPGAYNYNCNFFRYSELLKLTQSRKMVQMTQNGPIPQIEQCLQNGAPWGYFMSWNDLVAKQNTLQHTKAIYQSSKVITL